MRRFPHQASRIARDFFLLETQIRLELKVFEVDALAEYAMQDPQLKRQINFWMVVETMVPFVLAPKRGYGVPILQDFPDGLFSGDSLKAFRDAQEMIVDELKSLSLPSYPELSREIEETEENWAFFLKKST